MRTFKHLCRCFGLILLLQVLSVPALAQALPNLTTLRVRYNTQKNTVKPEGELKQKIDAVDREMAEASRLGRTGEVRRLLAKGATLLSGAEWTDVLDFTNSVVLRADRIVLDSAKPAEFRIEQIYMPSIALPSPLTARVSLQSGNNTRTLNTYDGVSRDLRESPFRFEALLSGTPDGSAVIKVELQSENQPLGAVQLNVQIVAGLDERLHKIDSSSAEFKGFDSLRGDIRYPTDYIRNVNLGRIALGQFDVARELTQVENTLVSLKEGKDPFKGKTGDFKRRYVFEEAGEIMPYRVYVPASYDGAKGFPLIIALHGLGGTEDSFFEGYSRLFPKLAEERGYIVAAPLGYRVDGFYGFGSTPANARERSEKDVMNVLSLMKRDYRIDENRIYLAGHSMGGIGTWHLGARYPDIWAALAPFSGLGNPRTVEKMKHIPQIVVHGDADPTVSVDSSRQMVAEMKRLGVEHQYIEVQGGNHTDVVAPNFGYVFDFLDKHRKKF